MRPEAPHVSRIENSFDGMGYCNIDISTVIKIFDATFRMKEGTVLSLHHTFFSLSYIGAFGCLRYVETCSSTIYYLITVIYALYNCTILY